MGDVSGGTNSIVGRLKQMKDLFVLVVYFATAHERVSDPMAKVLEGHLWVRCLPCPCV